MVDLSDARHRQDSERVEVVSKSTTTGGGRT